MTFHPWTVTFSDNHQLHFEAETLEACSGSGVLRACDAQHESILLIRGSWETAVRDGVTVMVTPAPAPPSSSSSSSTTISTGTGRPFA